MATGLFVSRRRLLVAAVAAPWAATRAATSAVARAVEYPAVERRALVFPRDHGAHPDYRIEWWYLTGWLEAQPQPLGFQVTFFRSRTPVDPANPSRFAAHQLLIAHAALADPARGALLHDQRIARSGFGIVTAAEHDTDVRLEDWQFRRAPDGAYACRIAGRSFELQFDATPTQPVILQGDAGFSRKGPREAQASHYYSQPHLAVRARLVREGRAATLDGRAWLDHEWSSTLLDPGAAGWDWIGMNLDDGGALTAFRIRRKGDDAPLWAYASLRTNANAPVQTFGPDAVRFEPLQTWRSARTGANYPVGQRVIVGTRRLETTPLFADQELDTRASSGAVYWEGASRLAESGRPVGRGYLELTGYVAPMAY
jgi:predicted secreted hydrolase